MTDAQKERNATGAEGHRKMVDRGRACVAPHLPEARPA